MLFCRGVVVSLRNGVIIQPEQFDCVTLMFCDIPVFDEIAAQCTPFEIIDFLDAVYILFDAVLPTYQVYKVETVRDSYIVGYTVKLL